MQNEKVTPTYELRIDLNVLEHLGFNLYSNVPAILTEMVANAWDADATRVDIRIDTSQDVIEILDDGHGMSSDDINNRYLRVGHRRRDKSNFPKSPGGREVMGRKGLGKLSLFSIAGVVEVHTRKENQSSALRMEVKAIEAAAKDNKPYCPDPTTADLSPDLEHGTRLILRQLRKERVRVMNLRQRLARRFSILERDDFRVYVDDQEVTLADRDDLRHVQFLWTIGGWSLPDAVVNPLETITLDGSLPDWKDFSWQIRGWIGTVAKPRQLVTDSSNLNSIVVMARGRLFQENILDRLNDGRLFTKYLTGQIEADFLDDDEYTDIATSDRQRIIEDDERYRALESFLRQVLNKMDSKWSEWRRRHGTKEAKKEHPVLGEWLDNLPSGYRDQAEGLIGKIQKLTLDDEDARREVFRNAILAFERLRLRGSTHELENALAVGAERLLGLLADRDSLEASLYRDIVRNRLDVISHLEINIQDDEREKVLQEYLFKHLWLLDPSWERATGSEILENPINSEFGSIKAGLTDEEKNGRVDIKYRNLAGKHIIIELKRASRKVSSTDLATQGQKYRNALRKCLKDLNRDNEPHEFIFVVGTPLKDADDQDYVKGQLASVNGRVVTYKQLIDSARQSYKEYLEASKELDRVYDLVQRL
ncbi:MAG: ATP-binding protein [Candidatus Contendobacter sp.]|nr:ATP-binding protein [Candidatus Contendobacter sp.]